MNCINRSVRQGSCFYLKHCTGYFSRRTNYLTVKPLINLTYNDVNNSDKCNRDFSSGVSKFLAVRSKCTSNFNVHHRLIPSITPGLSSHLLLLSSSSLLVLSLPANNVLYYSTEKSVKNTACNDSEKLKSSDPIPMDTDGDVVEKKLSLFQKFKEMYRDYWYVLLPVHMATSLVWFGGFYFLADSGVDIVSILEFIGLNEKIIEPFRNGNAHVKAGIIAVAFALYKIATPLRYAVTLGGTTFAINYLKRLGYIKPMPKKEHLKEMFLEQKDILMEKKQQLKSNVFQHLKEVESSSNGKRK